MCEIQLKKGLFKKIDLTKKGESSQNRDKILLKIQKNGAN